jgi:hypothetical protein
MTMPESSRTNPLQEVKLTPGNFAAIESVVLKEIDKQSDADLETADALSTDATEEIAVVAKTEQAPMAEKFRDREVVILFPGSLMHAASGLKKGQDRSTFGDAKRIFNDTALLRIAEFTKGEDNKLKVMSANTEQELNALATQIASEWTADKQPIVLVGCYKEDAEEFQQTLADKGVKAELNHSLVLRSR